MSQAAKAQEPSMEEILASIRRIIADDEAKPAPKPAEAAPAVAQAPADDPAGEPAAMSQDDIDAMLAGFDAAPDAQNDPVPAEESADVLELTAAMEAMAEPAPEFRTIDSDSDVVFGEPNPEPEPDFEPEPPRAAYRPAEPRRAMFEERVEQQLMSDHTTATVSSAFGSLAHTVLAQNARTIDDLVREMLRPMLKAWLDENLPTIVERLVRAEIERVSRGRG